MSESNLDFILYFESLEKFSEVKNGLDYIKNGQTSSAEDHFKASKVSDFSTWSFESTYTSDRLYAGSMLINPHGALEHIDFLSFFKSFNSSFLICIFTEDFGDSRSYAYQGNKKISAKAAKTIIANKDPNIAFQLALSAGKTGEAKKLVDDIDLNISIMGYPLFHYCVKNVVSAKPLINLLLDKGVDTSVVDKDGDSAVHAALIGGRCDTYPKEAKRIIEATPSFDVNQVNNEQQTCLHLAIDIGESTLIKLLLERGANPNVITSEGYTPLAQIVIGGGYEPFANFQAIIKLLDYGADVNLGREKVGNLPYIFYFLKNVGPYCNEGNSYSLKMDAKKRIRFHNQIKKISKKLIASGDDLFYVDGYGGNVLGYVNNVRELKDLCYSYGLKVPKFPIIEHEKVNSEVIHFQTTGEQEKLKDVFRSEKFESEQFGSKLEWYSAIVELELQDVLNKLLADFSYWDEETQLRYLEHLIGGNMFAEFKFLLSASETLTLNSQVNSRSKDTFSDLISGA